MYFLATIWLTIKSVDPLSKHKVYLPPPCTFQRIALGVVFRMFLVRISPASIYLFKVTTTETLESGAEASCFWHRFTDFGHTNLGMPKFSLK